MLPVLSESTRSNHCLRIAEFSIDETGRSAGREATLPLGFAYQSSIRRRKQKTIPIESQCLPLAPPHLTTYPHHLIIY